MHAYGEKKGKEMYKCLNCGRFIPYEDADHTLDYRGECWGAPAYEREPICPHCKGELEDIDYSEFEVGCYAESAC